MKALIPILLALLAYSRIGLAQFIPSQIYQERDGLASNWVMDMVQTPDREMWFATRGGISVFDGVKWKTYPQELGLPSGTGAKLEVVDDGSVLAFGHNQARLSLFHHIDEEWQQIPISFDTIYGGTSALLITATLEEDLNIIIAVNDRLFQFRSGSWTELIKPDGLRALTHIEWVGDKLYISSRAGLYSWDGQWEQISLSIDRVLMTYWEPTTLRHYLMSSSGIHYLDQQGKLNTIHKFFMTLTKLNDMNFFIDEPYVYYSANSHLIRLDPRTQDQIALIGEYFDGYSPTIKSIMDAEGNIWSSTRRGVMKALSMDFSFYNKNFGLTGNEVTATAVLPNGDIVAAGYAGFNIIRNGRVLESHSFGSVMSESRTMDIAYWDNKLFFAYKDEGMITYENGKIRKDKEGWHEVLDFEVFDNQLVVLDGTTLKKYEDGRWSTWIDFSHQKRNIGYSRKIVTAKDQLLVLGRIGIYDPINGEHRFSELNRLNDVFALYEFGDSILLGTFGGLKIIQEGKIADFVFQGRSFDKPVYTIHSDTNDHLWIGTDMGLYHIDDHWHAIDSETGLTGNEVNRNAILQTDEKLWVGTDKGLTCIQLKGLECDPAIPLPKVSKMTISEKEQSYELIKDIVSPYDEDTYVFEFKGISMVQPNVTNYRVRLNGFDDDWIYIPNYAYRRVAYTNLRPGSYGFEVQSRAGDGPWSLSAHSGKITITPLFYQTYWFYIVMGVLLAIAVYVVIKQRTIGLEKAVRGKTRELSQQNIELTEALKKLKSAQTQLINREKLTSLGMLTAGLAHEINNPLNYVRGGAKSLERNVNDLLEIQKEQEQLIDQVHQLLDGSDEQKIDWDAIRTRCNELQEKQEDYEVDELVTESHHLIESISAGVTKTSDIILKLRSFSNDSTGEWAKANIEDEMDNSLKFLKRKIPENVEIIKEYEKIPEIECNAAKFIQAFMNLFLNAIESIEGPGSVLICTRPGDEGFVRVLIIDDGKGISSSDQSLIFEPFYTTRNDHVGLGLSLAQSIIKEHKGHLSIYSDGKKGTRVTIDLPLHQH